MHAITRINELWPYYMALSVARATLPRGYSAVSLSLSLSLSLSVFSLYHPPHVDPFFLRGCFSRDYLQIPNRTANGTITRDSGLPTERRHTRWKSNNLVLLLRGNSL